MCPVSNELTSCLFVLQYQVSLGTTDPFEEDKIIIASKGDFGVGAEHTFLASPDEDQAEASWAQPTDGPYLTLQIQFDGYPAEIGWILRSNLGVASQERMEGRQTTNTIAFRPPRHYNASLANTLVTETIAIPAENADYTFILTDSFGDGLCCDSGTGSYFLWQGPPEDNILLASGDAQGQSRDISDFTLTFTPSASPADNAPAPAPTPVASLPSVDVRIELQFDSYPQETGWKIRDSAMNEIISKPPGTYTTPNAQVSEIVSLESGRSYLFTILDNFGDGMCCTNGEGSFMVFIDETDQLVAFGSEFTTDESHRFVIGNGYPITVVIGTDQYSNETGWYMERLDLEEGSANVVISPFEYGDRPSTIITEPIIGEEGGIYRFVMLDRESDGTCCEHGDGFYRVFVGSADTSDENNAVVYSRGDLFNDRAEHVFMAQWPQVTNDNLPSDSPVLTLEFYFDDYPQDVFYVLKADDVNDGVAASRSLSQQSVIAFGPPEPFPDSLKGQTTTIEIKIPQIAAGTTRGFTFMYIDTQNDGLCCSYGSGKRLCFFLPSVRGTTNISILIYLHCNVLGSYALYYGPKTNNQVLASGTAENSGRAIHSFVLSDSAVISVSSSNSGSSHASPWPMTLFAALASTLWFFYC